MIDCYEPTAEELGYADKVFVDELGDTSIVVFRMIDKVIITPWVS